MCYLCEQERKAIEPGINDIMSMDGRQGVLFHIIHEHPEHGIGSNMGIIGKVNQTNLNLYFSDLASLIKQIASDHGEDAVMAFVQAMAILVGRTVEEAFMPLFAGDNDKVKETITALILAIMQATEIAIQHAEQMPDINTLLQMLADVEGLDVDGEAPQDD